MKNKILANFLIVLTLLCVACTHTNEGTPMTWTEIATPGTATAFPGVARASACGFAAEGKLFVGLGRSGSRGTLLKDFWCYDVQDSTWSRLADFPSTARTKAVAVYMNGAGYVGMGASNVVYDTFQDFWKYDIASNTWSQVDSFPAKSSNELRAAVVDGSLYTVWGFDGRRSVRELYKYDPANDAWALVEGETPMWRLSAVSFGLGPYFFAGSGILIDHYTDFNRFDSQTQTWKRCANMPNKRMLSNAVGVGQKGYCLLGRYWAGSLNDGRLLSDVWEYDPASDEWTSRGDFPGGARQNAVVLELDGCGYVLFGENDTERKSDVWKFVP